MGRVIGRRLLKLRFTRSAVQTIKAKQSTEVIAFLLHGGVDLLYTLRLLDEMGVAGMQSGWKEVVNSIERGSLFSEAMGRLPEIPAVVTDMIALSEQTGDLAVGMQRIVVFLERALERNTERLLQVIEPLCTIALGIVIGGATLLLMWPMMDLIKRLT